MTQFVALLRRPFAAVALLAVPAAMLAGCGQSRDGGLAEKVARAENAAAKAEQAQQAAERAARAAEARLNQINAARDYGTRVPVGDEPGPEEPIDTANASHRRNTDLVSALAAPAR